MQERVGDHPILISLKFQLSSLRLADAAGFLLSRKIMPDQAPRDLRERAFQFTCALFDFCEDLSRSSGPRRRIAEQLFDAGSAVAANLEEAKAAYSRRELAAKSAIALKETREAKYWLRVAEAKSLGKRELRDWLLQEVDEFVAMLTVAVRRLQS